MRSFLLTSIVVLAVLGLFVTTDSTAQAFNGGGLFPNLGANANVNGGGYGLFPNLGANLGTGTWGQGGWGQNGGFRLFSNVGANGSYYGPGYYNGFGFRDQNGTFFNWGNNGYYLRDANSGGLFYRDPYMNSGTIFGAGLGTWLRWQ